MKHILSLKIVSCCNQLSQQLRQISSSFLCWIECRHVSYNGMSCSSTYSRTFCCDIIILAYFYRTTLFTLCNFHNYILTRVLIAKSLFTIGEKNILLNIVLKNSAVRLCLLKRRRIVHLSVISIVPTTWELYHWISR